VAELLAERLPAPLERMGLEEGFGDTSARYDEMLAHMGLTTEHVVAAARRAVGRKR
jgi:transketolase C-terminal domain/subunit